ncbi:hypothetical protein CMQ_5739 [Grosmannia clavigera kw1407]|uniref:Uncharacterized protein n=1 Tax=Grosmannia clavigera (strain kw1407 / UAMH 11150) TaxID=655863 RepID=F0XT32_GROCL|nr:uncharacterized protein CMQ_5739 [Grosmannia clavigera kw1407]EFW99318.1 hypothetical protein CMQ_5739 [Grosmannia clavigera kw1407]
MDSESSYRNLYGVPKSQPPTIAQSRLRTRKPKQTRAARSRRQSKQAEDTHDDVTFSDHGMSSAESVLLVDNYGPATTTPKKTAPKAREPNGGTSYNEGAPTTDDDEPSLAIVREGQIREPKREGPTTSSEPVIFRANLEDALVVSYNIASYTSDLVRNALRLAKPFLTALVAVWLLIATVQHFIFPAVEQALVFGCRLPLMPMLHVCQVSLKAEASKVGTSRVKEIMKPQSDYSEILQFVGERRTIPFDLLRSANKAADLQVEVAQSNLPSRDELSTEFGIFDRDVNSAAATFREFVAQVQSSGQALVNVDNSMMRRLTSLNLNPSIWTETVNFLNIFSGDHTPAAEALRTIFDEYLQLLSISIERIDEVLEITERTLAELEILRQDTKRIYTLTRADEKQINQARGDEKRKWLKKTHVLKEFQDQLRLLDSVDVHRDKAVAFVIEVKDKTDGIRVALKELKRQAMKPQAQSRWNDISEESLERHLQAWHMALGQQISTLEQKLEAAAPGSVARRGVEQGRKNTISSN